MKKYADYLRSIGASEEEIKILVTPTAERAYTQMQADLAKANTAVTGYQNWFEKEATPAFKKLQTELVVAKADEARARGALIAARDKGLIDLTKDLGYEVDPEKVAAATAAAAAAARGATFDPDKYIDRDTFMKVLTGEGDAIAAAQDIAYEHTKLFPDKPLNFRKLRSEAVAKGISVEQHWMDTFGVTQARETQATAAREAHDKAMREEGAKVAREEFASRYGNPDTRPLVPSVSPFAPRPTTGREKQPWEAGDRSIDRVQRATRHVIEQQAGGAAAKPN